MRQRRRESVERGFTLLEIMIVVAILAIIASIGVPQYVSALRIARIGKAKHELVTISHAITGFMGSNGGQLPLTLYQVGFGGRRDPWGVPYCYLNYSDGTGDGLQWAIKAGLVDPSAVVVADAGSSDRGRNRVGEAGPRLAGFLCGASLRPQGPVVPVVPPIVPPVVPPVVPPIIPPVVPPVAVPPIVLPSVLPAVVAVTNAILGTLGRTLGDEEAERLASTIASSPGFTMFATVPTDTTRRRDRYMFPLNTDYDLFSLGPNGLTSVSLGESMAQDDVIRANNGGYFGTASEY